MIAALWVAVSVLLIVRLRLTSPLRLKRVDIVFLTGGLLAAWLGFLALNMLLPVFIAFAFAAGVEWYIRRERARWAQEQQCAPLTPEEYVRHNYEIGSGAPVKLHRVNDVERIADEREARRIGNR